MTGRIDPTSDRAVYKQIADHLRVKIVSGELAPGKQLPSESNLVEQYDVSRVTARRALAILAGEGLTVSEHGRGVFVRPRPPVRRLASDRFARRHRDAGKAAFTVEMEQADRKYDVKSDVQMLRLGPERPPADIAERLGTGENEVLVRSRRYVAEGYPLEIATSYIPMDIAEGTPIAQPDSGPGGIYARIEDQGYQLSRFQEGIAVRLASDTEARALRLSTGSPVIRLVRSAYAGDRVVEVCDTVMNASAFELSYELPAT